MAFAGNTTWYLSSARWSAVTAWATGAAKTVGALVRQNATPTAGNERVFVCIVAGTTHASTEPTWVITRGAKTTDNTITWQEVTGVAALNGDLTNAPNWQAVKSTAVTLGHVIKDAAGTHVFICTTAGTAGSGSEPTWNASALGNTTTDSSVTWTYIGTSFGAWAAPHARLNNALATNWGDTGTTFFVGSDHAETQATSLTMSNRGTDTAPIDIICVDVAGSMPPVSADLTDTASISTTSSANVTLNGALRMCYGITFSCGSSGFPALNVNGGSSRKHYERCVFAMGSGTTSNSRIGGTENTVGRVEFRNCKFRFANTGQAWQPGGHMVVYDSDELVDSGGTIPSTFIINGSTNNVQIRDCDLSSLSGSTIVNANSSATFSTITLLDCKMPSSYTLSTTPGSPATRVHAASCDGGTAFSRAELYEFMGTMLTDYVVVRDDGATLDGVGVSWSLSTTVNANMNQPLSSFVFAQWNPVTGSNVTATVYGIANASAMLTNADLWIEFDYPGDSASPRHVLKSSGIVDVLATPANLTADTAAWDGAAAARANSHAYALGDVIKLASNSGRLFFCTTAGTSSGSEPGGYASAVDGGSVTDGAAVFRAGWRFKIAVTFTSPQPQIEDVVSARARLAKPSTACFIDPKIALS